MNQRKPILHAKDHLPGGADPIPGLFAGATGDYTNTILAEPSLVAYWPLTDASGNAHDQSGHGHDLLPGGTPTYNQPFDTQTAGTPADDPAVTDVIDIPGATSVKLDGGSQASASLPGTLDCFYKADTALDGYVAGHSGVSFECWVNPPAYPVSFAGICQSGWDKASISQPVAFTLQLRSSGQLFWQAGTSYQITSVLNLNIGVWTHIVGTLSATAGGHLYFNGDEVGNGANFTPNDQCGTFVLGGMINNVGTANNVNARVAQAAIYSAALSGAAAFAHYKAAVKDTGTFRRFSR